MMTCNRLGEDVWRKITSTMVLKQRANDRRGVSV